MRTKCNAEAATATAHICWWIPLDWISSRASSPNVRSLVGNSAQVNGCKSKSNAPGTTNEKHTHKMESLCVFFCYNKWDRDLFV